MPPPTHETQEDIKNLDKRIDVIGNLDDSSIKNFFAADTLEHAEKSLFEWAFIRIASEQIHGQRMRYEEEGDSEDRTTYIGKALQALEQIKNNGDWSFTKEIFRRSLNCRELTFDVADEYGINRDLQFDGVRIFYKDVHVGTDQAGIQYRAWDDYMREKLTIIPDKTEPYVYPDLEVLKRSVEFSS